MQPRERTPGHRFDRFNPEARALVTETAEEMARARNYRYIGTDHLVIALANDPTMEPVFSQLGVAPQEIVTALDLIDGKCEEQSPDAIFPTPRLIRVIELAEEETLRTSSPEVTTAHLLLGVVREGQSMGAGVLESLGVTLEKARAVAIN